MTDDDEVHIGVNDVNYVAVTWGETFRHVIAPSLIGVALGSFWQVFVQDQVSWTMPNPVQAALLICLLFGPLLNHFLAQASLASAGQYTLGFALSGGFFMLVWTTGYGGFICGGYLAMVVWLWMSTSWWRYHLPPFRYAVWHSVGVNLGALGGSIISYNLFM